MAQDPLVFWESAEINVFLSYAKFPAKLGVRVSYTVRLDPSPCHAVALPPPELSGGSLCRPPWSTARGASSSGLASPPTP